MLPLGILAKRASSHINPIPSSLHPKILNWDKHYPILDWDISQIDGNI